MMKWRRIKTYSGLDDKSSSEMEIITNFGPTKAGTVLAPFMNEFFRNKVEKLKQKVSPSLSRSLYYTSKYREKVCGLAQEEFSFKGIA